MSNRTTGGSSFLRVFYGMIAAMVAVTILLVVVSFLAGSLSGARKSAGGQADKTTLSERLAPLGTLNVAGAAVTTVTGTAVAAPAAVDGKATYDSACAACHTTGVAGAPKIGDAAGWKERLAQGKDTLYQHAIKGFQGKSGMMPAKGGNAALSDTAVKAAVDHMLAGTQ